MSECRRHRRACCNRSPWHRAGALPTFVLYGTVHDCRRSMNRLVALALVSLLLAPARAHAQESDTQPTWSLLPHPDDQWWSLSGQVNVIEQAHPSFPSPYAGPNSFRAERARGFTRADDLHRGAARSRVGGRRRHRERRRKWSQRRARPRWIHRPGRRAKPGLGRTIRCSRDDQEDRRAIA